MSYYAVPPPSSLTKGRATASAVSKEEKRRREEEYYTMEPHSAGARKHVAGDDGVQVKRRRDGSPDEKYFDDEDEESSGLDTKGSGQKYSKSTGRGQLGPSDEKEEEEEDELEAFMSGINAQAEADQKASLRKEEVTEGITASTSTAASKGLRNDIEEEDVQESYFNFLEEYKARHEDENEDVYEYDEDGRIIWTWKKTIDPLPPTNHDLAAYKPFNKDLYTEHEEIARLSSREVFELRNRLEIRVYGSNAPKPIVSFAHLSFDEGLMKQIRRSEYEKPTPIQAQAIPAAIKGRDVLGLAKTGSGKTVAYLWPAIIHILDQEELSYGDGPIALVVVPTRELAIQVYQQAKIYCKPYNINVCCAYGGGSKYEQKQALEAGAELVIATPGRIIDLVKIGATNFKRTTLLVFDEVDRMFDLGFEPQVKSIADNIRPNRQCLMFSATMKAKVEKLVAHALNDPVKIVCGDVGEVNADVQQSVYVLPSQEAKYGWLFSRYVQLCTEGKLLIFVTRKVDAEEVAKKLRLRDSELVLLHGDQHQYERNEKVTAFRTRVPVMVATDVAARGLDIPEIRNVVNFDVARDIDTHIHRVGRTGRAGQRGHAYTLITEADKEFGGHLVRNLEASGQEVPAELLNLALKSEWFKKQRERDGTGSTAAIRPGLSHFKPRERPGFGLHTATPSLSALSSTARTTSGGESAAQPSIGRILEKAKAFVESASGNEAGMNRGEMMRSAMRSSFQYKFQRSSTNELAASRPVASDPVPEWKRRLEASVASINKTIAEKETPAPVEEAAPEPERTRGSRWGQRPS